LVNGDPSDFVDFFIGGKTKVFSYVCPPVVNLFPSFRNVIPVQPNMRSQYGKKASFLVALSNCCERKEFSSVYFPFGK
tara:strand:- start:128 stop:361 length:234 start_codon:yes stop_codon:yes gene_type:complete